MVDAAVSKTVEVTLVRVRLSPSAPSLFIPEKRPGSNPVDGLIQPTLSELALFLTGRRSLQESMIKSCCQFSGDRECIAIFTR